MPDKAVRTQRLVLAFCFLKNNKFYRLANCNVENIAVQLSKQRLPTTWISLFFCILAVQYVIYINGDQGEKT